jgi:hypothetical protein
MSLADKHGVSNFPEAKGAWCLASKMRSSGVATMGMDRPDGGHFDCPLITQVEGNLWQGGCIGGAFLDGDFKYVISLYPWEQYMLPKDCERTEIEMYDHGELPDLEQLDKIATFVNQCKAKGKTLVHCQAGLNRSALVTARALILEGGNPSDVIKLLREKRCDMVLCNQPFENWLLGL